MSTRVGSSGVNNSSGSIQRRPERPPRARPMNDQTVNHLKTLCDLAVADKDAQEAQRKELSDVNAALDRIDGQMKEDNAGNKLRFECLQEEQKRLTNILADDTDRRKQ